MPNFFPPQSASYLGRSQLLNWTGSGTIVSTNFGPETFHVRILSQVAGFITIDSSGATAPTSAGGGALIAANTATGDYFKCRPGQIVQFSSSSTSSGSLTVSELS
jgi:hypothetical protein